MEFGKYNEKPTNSYSRRSSHRKIIISASQCSTPIWKDSPFRKARSNLKERFIQHQREFDQFVLQHYQKEPAPRFKYDMSRSLEKKLDSIQVSGASTPVHKIPKEINTDRANLKTISGSDLHKPKQFQFKLKLDQTKKVRIPEKSLKIQRSQLNWMIQTEEHPLDFPTLVSSRNSALHGHFEEFRIKNQYDLGSSSESLQMRVPIKKSGRKFKRGFTEALRNRNIGELKSLRHKSMYLFPRRNPIGARKLLEISGNKQFN